MNFQTSRFNDLIKKDVNIFDHDFIKHVIGIKDSQWFVDVIEKYCIVNRKGLKYNEYVRILDYMINLKIFSEITELSFAEKLLIEKEIYQIPKKLDQLIKNNFKNPKYEKF